MTAVFGALLAISFASALIATGMLFLCRKKGDSVGEMCLKGTFIYRELDEYVERQYIGTIRVLTTAFIVGFIVALIGLLLTVRR
jgi:hypothetical protein